MIQKLKIEAFLPLLADAVVLDVRSPGEFAHARIGGAISLPLFTDDERKVVGTLYKQRSREDAIKAGLDFFGVKMRAMVEHVEQLCPDKSKQVLVHCWRGGMRSAAVAWLLDMYGFKVSTLVGGYKAYRRWALEQFQKSYNFNIVGGYTGSGKTDILYQMDGLGECVIDLEAVARHKGSAFGGYGQVQGSQEMFENELAFALYQSNQRLTEGQTIWLEDESQRIGLVNIPMLIWNQMRNSPVYFLDIPFEHRLNYIVSEYGKQTKEALVNGIIRIKKRLGGVDCKNAIGYLVEDDTKECFRILLKYYDKSYLKGLHKRDGLNDLLHSIDCEFHNPLINSQQLLATFRNNKGES